MANAVSKSEQTNIIYLFTLSTVSDVAVIRRSATGH